MTSFEAKGFRDKLAEEIKEAPKNERRSILDEAQKSEEYWTAWGEQWEKRHPAKESDTRTAKLAEYLTGFKLDDPRLVDKLIEDKERIRAKYDLPPDALAKSSPYEFENRLNEIAKKFKIEIQKRVHFADFFTEHPYVEGVSIVEEKRVGVDIDRNDPKEYARTLEVLEHELVHAMQGILSPRMPIEVMEYEAYVGANIHHLENMKNDPDSKDALEFIFGFMIGRSVEHWYQEQSKKRGEELRPAWEQ